MRSTGQSSNKQRLSPERCQGTTTTVVVRVTRVAFLLGLFACSAEAPSNGSTEDPLTDTDSTQTPTGDSDPFDSGTAPEPEPRWAPRGVGGGGATSALSFSPYTDLWFVGTDMGTLFRSVDRGQSWWPVRDGNVARSGGWSDAVQQRRRNRVHGCVRARCVGGCALPGTVPRVAERGRMYDTWRVRASVRMAAERPRACVYARRCVPGF